MALTDGEMAALQNLARKKAGAEVDYINIADARSLTDLGLAERRRGGWEITSAGLKAAGLQQTSDAPNEKPIDIRRPRQR